MASGRPRVGLQHRQGDASAATIVSQALNTDSAPQAVTVTNTGTQSAALTSIGTSGDFSQTNTCTASLAAGAACTINVTFRPTAPGTRTGAITITSNASNSPTSI